MKSFEADFLRILRSLLQEGLRALKRNASLMQG